MPLQGCNNQVPVNVLGVQVPVNRGTGALGALLGSATAASSQNESCKQASAQDNSMSQDPQRALAHYQSAHCSQMSGDGWSWSYEGPSGDNGGLVNLSHNQVPVQVCNNRVPVNVLGVQVPVDTIAAALGIAAPASTVTSQNSTCDQGSSQQN